MNVIAIFDVGKTNKKLLLFNEEYKIVWEQTHVFEEITDEDGEPCEDLEKLTAWVLNSLRGLYVRDEFRIRAVNFSAYGASLVHIGKDGRPLTPLYNYLKPYPVGLRQKFYDAYGGEAAFSLQTASPVLGSLNSGMQIYRIKEQDPALFAQIKYTLHLPQYLSYLLTGMAWSEITSIGCHTNLWNFSRNHYHEWVYREGILDKLAPLSSSSMILPVIAGPEGAALSGTPAFSGPLAGCVAGTGLHDSSAAMIPYLENSPDPFVLISTGTWCISMNPFNQSPLTIGELQKDCLCYMSYLDRPVKASRLFAGYEHEQETRRLSTHFGKAPDYHVSVNFDPAAVIYLQGKDQPLISGTSFVRPGPSVFVQRDLYAYDSYELAYHRLLMDIMEQQVASTSLVLKNTKVKKIFVDGGFGRNQVYMHLLAAAFPEFEVFAASMPQATAMGAALALHSHWNFLPMERDIIRLKGYK
jgi:sugar (pentulose or hexulose) kinase